MTDVLDVKGLTVRYGGNVAVDRVDLSLAAGTMIGVVGANGAGKTSLLNAVAGWSRGKGDVSGTVLVNGGDVTKVPSRRRASLGITLVPESRSVFYDLSVEENLRLAMPGGLPADREPPSIDDIYELFPSLARRVHHLGSQLSGGERQMLAIGRALRSAPRVLLLDEPSIGLAPMVVSELLAAVRKLVDEGLTVLLAEQNVAAALKVVDAMNLLVRGRIVGHGTPDEVKSDPRLTEAYLGEMA